MTTFFKSVATLLAIVLFSKTCLSQSNSIHLDGVDDYIEMDDIITSLVGKTNFSIEITTKLDIEQPQDYAVLFSANSNTAQLHRFLIRLSGTDESISNVVVLNIPANGQ
jgi:hypothetical protein